MKKPEFDSLTRKAVNLFERYKNFLSHEDRAYERDAPYTLFKVITIDADLFEFKFKFAHRLFIIKATFFISSQTVYLRTFELVAEIGMPDRIKSNPISQLDIVSSDHENRFVEKKEEQFGMMKNPTGLRDFGVEYSTQFWKVFQEIEKAEMPELEPIG